MHREELRRRLATRPSAVRFEELRRLLEAYGWRLARIRGSHHVFQQDKSSFSIPLRRPHVLAVYVRRAIELTEEGPIDGNDAR